MSEDVLQKYQSLVNELKELLGQSNFDSLFNAKTKDLKSSDRFLIKMEMNRLSQPIDRFIDLRGQVNGDVKPYVYNGKQHFMDHLAIEVFEREIKRRKGYTLAVYEAVMNNENNYKVMQKKALENGADDLGDKASRPNCNHVHFASYESRSEERMNYSIKVRLLLDHGNEIQASTSDISVSGCKIKLPVRYNLEPEQSLRMRLTGLEQDFEMGLRNGLEYEVVAVEPVNDQYKHVRMKRTYTEDNHTIDEFLKSFIQGNKRRYKVNLDNTLEAVVVKGYEQYYLPRSTGLLVFLAAGQQSLLPKLVLTNENNVNVARYFNDENRNSVLYSILTKPRINQLLAQPQAVKQTMLYCFTHIAKGKLYYYSATSDELLKTPNLQNLFLGFASQKASWRIFNLQMVPCSSNDAHIPLSLPESASKEIAKLNKPPSPRVMGILQHIGYQLFISEVSNPASTECYQANRFESNQVNALKQFGHAKLQAYPPLEFVGLDYVNLRSETRYLYQTHIVLQQEDSGPVHGNTLDFSVNGLQLELTDPCHYEKGDLILVAFPELQRLTKKHQLSNLPYEVMAINKTRTIINLRTYKAVEDQVHPGAAFLNQLIENNKSKLKAAEEGPKVPGLSTALRNMATKNIANCPFYVHKKGASIRVGAIGKGCYSTSFHTLYSHCYHLKGEFNLEFLFGKEQFENLLALPIKNAKRQDPPLQLELLVRLNPQHKILNTAITSEVFTDKDPLKERRSFVNASAQDDLFFAYRIFVSRTGRPDTDYIAKELSYISHYALHKAKLLEDELWSVIGVAEVIDITQEVLIRYGIDSSIQKQLQSRALKWESVTAPRVKAMFEHE